MPILTNGPILQSVKPQLNEEEQLERRIREELLSAINHDLRSPLGAIGIFCEILLLNTTNLEDNQRQSLTMIQEANAKAQRILDDAAEITSIYKGTVTLRATSTDFREMVQETLGRFHEMTDKKNISVAVDSPGPIPVMVDKEKAEQLMLRVMEEALAYASANATIHLQFKDTGGRAELQISTKGTTPAAEIATKRPPPSAVKGRLGNRKPTDSRYSLLICEKLAQIMDGTFSWNLDESFTARLAFPHAAG